MSRIFIIFFALLSCTLIAQRNFVDGSITKLNGEIIKGKINYREWIKTPQEISFQPKDAPDQVIKYTAKTIAGFKIDHNNELYQSAVVAINNEPVEDGELREFESSDKTISIIQLDQDTVFLMTLIKGKVNLFFLEDDAGKQHFFTQVGNNKIEELIYRRVIVRNNNNQNTFSNPTGIMYSAVGSQSAPYEEVFFYDYRKQLLDLMPDCPSIYSDINRSLYSYALLNLLKKYNTCVNELTYIKPKDKANHFIYLYAGAAQPFMTLKDTYNNAPRALTTSPGISTGVGLDIGIIRTNNRLSLGIEMNYARSSSQSTQLYTPADGLNKNIHYDINLWGLRFNALLKYVLLKGSIKPYVKAGIGKSSYSTTKFLRTEMLVAAPFDATITERNLVTSELHGIIGIGVKVNNFFLESRYESGNDINRTTGEDLEMTRLSVLAGYALPLNK